MNNDEANATPKLRYECDCCGTCCQGHLIVETDILDVLREPRLVAADPHHAGKSASEVLEMLWDDKGKAIVIACGTNRPCPFLNDEKRCSIYPTRPNDCVAMQAGDDQCQRARESAGLEPLPPIVDDTL